MDYKKLRLDSSKKPAYQPMGSEPVNKTTAQNPEPPIEKKAQERVKKIKNKGRSARAPQTICGAGSGPSGLRDCRLVVPDSVGSEVLAALGRLGTLDSETRTITFDDEQAAGCAARLLDLMDALGLYGEAAANQISTNEALRAIAATLHLQGLMQARFADDLVSRAFRGLLEQGQTEAGLKLLKFLSPRCRFAAFEQLLNPGDEAMPLTEKQRSRASKLLFSAACAGIRNGQLAQWSHADWRAQECP